MHLSDETLVPSLSDETALYHEVIPRTLLCRITSWDRGLDCHLLPLAETGLVTRLRLAMGRLTSRPIKPILESIAVRKVEYAAAKLACANYCNPANQARELINRFFEPVPPELLAAASTFKKMAFPVLRLMRQSESACDFMDSNPALLWAIACCVVEGSITPDHAAELVTGNHKKIARAVFGEQSTVTSAFLKKPWATPSRSRSSKPLRNSPKRLWPESSSGTPRASTWKN